jgi:hypothetical protein
MGVPQSRSGLGMKKIHPCLHRESKPGRPTHREVTRIDTKRNLNSDHRNGFKKIPFVRRRRKKKKKKK